MKLFFFLLLLMFATFSTEIENAENPIIGVFRDTETEEISWEDPKNLISNEIKQEIEEFLKQKIEKSSRLFRRISNWSLPDEADAFVKHLTLFIFKTIDVDTRDEYEQTPLMIAVQLGAERSVGKLIERGAQIEAYDGFGMTALHWAAQVKGSESCCRILLKNGANPNAQEYDENTPLIHAARVGNVKVVKLLLEFGADVKIKNKCGRNALHRATESCAEVIRAHQRLNLYPNESSIKVLRDMETDDIFWEDPENLIGEEQKEHIETALKQKEEIMADRLFDCISNVHFFSPEARPFYKELLFAISETVPTVTKKDMMLAARFDAEKAVAKLIERGVNVEEKDQDEWTALHYATMNGSESCIKLLERGANLNAKTKLGYTGLMLAAMYGRVEVVKHLLRSGANTKLQDFYGNTALAWAEMQGRRICADIISAHAAKLRISEKPVIRLVERESTDEFGYSPLHWAAKSGNELTCKNRLLKGANVNVIDKHGYTPLMIAAMYGRVEMAKLLLRFGANTKVKDNHGGTALSWAETQTKGKPYALGNCADVLRAHEANNPEKGTKMEEADVDGWTVLHFAARNGNESTWRVRLEKGANVNIQDKNGYTPLMIAATFGRVEIVNLLLEYGAQTEIKDKQGNTALTYARKSCADILKVYEAKNSQKGECLGAQKLQCAEPFALTHNSFYL